MILIKDPFHLLLFLVLLSYLIREEKKEGKKGEKKERKERQKKKVTKNIDYRPSLFLVKNKVIHKSYI